MGGFLPVSRSIPENQNGRLDVLSSISSVELYSESIANGLVVIRVVVSEILTMFEKNPGLV